MKKWYLGKIKGTNEAIYLKDFSWDCDWYWAGGYLSSRRMHCHFDGCFLNVPDPRGHPLRNFVTPWAGQGTVISNGAAAWESLSFFLDDAQYDPNEWWRIKDLFKQFYALKNAAEVFQYGGHCTSQGRTPQEINKDMAAAINRHIETVIIPQVRLALDRAPVPEPAHEEPVGNY